MGFELTEEQGMIQRAADDFLAAVAAEKRHHILADGMYMCDPAVWTRLCSELSLQSVLIPERFSGLGLTQVELVIILEQMGRHLFCGPYLATQLVVNALLLAGTEEQQAYYFDAILGGATAALAYCGKPGCWDSQCVTAYWANHGDGYRIDGDYHYVIDGQHADFLVLAAHESSASTHELALFICDTKQPGISIEPLPTLDLSRSLARLHVRDLVLDKNNKLNRSAISAEDSLSRLINLAIIAQAAEQSGGAQKVLEMSVQYLGERQQFGRPLAGFQALKHKAADMQLQAELARSAVYYAACVASESRRAEDAPQLCEAASIAKVQCSESFFFNAGTALQLHGGVGFTWEYDVHLYFKRAKAAQLFFGHPVEHRERLAESLLNPPVVRTRAAS